jgi:hypothetical protein
MQEAMRNKLHNDIHITNNTLKEAFEIIRGICIKFQEKQVMTDEDLRLFRKLRTALNKIEEVML